MSNFRDALTPGALDMIAMVHRTGSMAAAARELGLVPSALTYRVRQLESALDVLLRQFRYMERDGRIEDSSDFDDLTRGLSPSYRSRVPTSRGDAAAWCAAAW